MIHITNMSKVYKMGNNYINALDSITLNIEKHDFVAIVGPSGSGKSTLMNMLGCLDVATSGSYILDNMEIKSLDDNKLAEIRNQKIGFIFQGFNLLQKLTAIENVELPLIYQGIKSKERYTMSYKALKTVGLEDRIHHKPTELSGGQQQRVAIARALSGNPPLILADEPTGNLDSKSGLEIMDVLKNLNDLGNTIILITQDINIAMKAKRIVSICDGRIIEDRRTKQ